MSRHLRYANTFALHRQQPDRSLVLLDIENLVGGSRNANRVPAVVDCLRSEPWMRDRSLVICSSGPTLARSAMFDVPMHWRYVIGRGLDGADLALISAAEPILHRFRRLVVGSGDHMFAEVARRFDGECSIIAQRGQLSRTLAAAATTVTIAA